MPADLHLAGHELVVEYRSGDYIVRPIDGLAFEVASGQLALLLGASGCGKTTLLSILASILRPARGSVQLGGVEVTALSGSALTEYRRHRVGIVFQAFNLIPSLNASENVQVPLRATGLGARAARERADGLLETVGLADRRHHRPGNLSGGQQQRVAIARALAHDPPLVLADEPTAHLDYMQVEAVLELLRDIADSGRIVVVSTHDDRMIALADKVVAMSPRADGVSGVPEEVRLAAGETLFRQGDAGELVYVVGEGSVELVRERVDGTEELLAVIAEGNYFGELAPLFGIRRSATARAKAPTVLTAMSVTEFRRRTRGQRLWRALD
ncbi:MAG: ATP-binding cassette domain-containing protein [Gaiellaceae bacterium]